MQVQKARLSAKKKKRHSLSHVRSVKGEANTLEDRIVGLAMSGKLAAAGKNAIDRQLAKGLPVVFKRGNKIIRKHPDGSIETLATVKTQRFDRPSKVAIFKSK